MDDLFKMTLEEEIDAFTELNIKNWCKEQGKCEEYYLRKGILDENNVDFLEYLKICEEYISEGRLKKEKLKSS